MLAMFALPATLCFTHVCLPRVLTLTQSCTLCLRDMQLNLCAFRLGGASFFHDLQRQLAERSLE
jgi:hypothetical protein